MYALIRKNLIKNLREKTEAKRIKLRRPVNLKDYNCQILLIKDYLRECSVSTSGSFDWLRGLHG